MDIEGLKAYQKWAITKKADDLTEREAKLTWALGLVDEAIEVWEWEVLFSGGADPLEYLCELGDTAWYAVVLADAYQVDIQSLVIAPQALDQHSLPTNNLLSAARKIGELVKKNIGHGHPMPLEKLTGLLSAIFNAIDQLAIESCVDLAIVLEINLYKLNSRYEDGFSSASSQDRDRPK